MRLVQSALVATALIVATSASQTQSAAQSAYDYPWCALYPRGNGATSCYYATREQCMETLSGIGGTCILSPFYRGPPPPARRRRTPD